MTHLYIYNDLAKTDGSAFVFSPLVLLLCKNGKLGVYV